jgi:biopolymer transport protein TolR
MAVQLSSRSSGRRRRRSATMMSEINVTPMVDVMLVLLIIFMVAAPMLTVSVPVDLPRTQGQNTQSEQQPLIVTITAKGDVYLQDTKVELESLAPRLAAMKGINPDVRIYVRGDKNLAYGRIMEVMGTLSGAGFKKVALVADLPKK